MPARDEVDHRPAVLQTAFDDDTGETSDSDHLFTQTHGPHYFRAGRTSRTFSYPITVKPWDGGADPYVELQRWVRFEVCSGNLCQWFPPDFVWLPSPATKFLV
jgi:hypothetical protein